MAKEGRNNLIMDTEKEITLLKFLCTKHPMALHEFTERSILRITVEYRRRLNNATTNTRTMNNLACTKTLPYNLRNIISNEIIL